MGGSSETLHLIAITTRSHNGQAPLQLYLEDYLHSLNTRQLPILKYYNKVTDRSVSSSTTELLKICHSKDPANNFAFISKCLKNGSLTLQGKVFHMRTLVMRRLPCKLLCTHAFVGQYLQHPWLVQFELADSIWIRQLQR